MALSRTQRIFPWLLIVFSWRVEFSVAAPSPGVGGLDAYRKFALTHEGDVTRGAALFADEQRSACAKCHSIDGRASKAGPDLFAVGDKFGRRDLVDAILLPSETISPGYGAMIVETKSGEEYLGVVKESTASRVTLMGADGRAVAIATKEIREQRGSSVSMMPDGLQAGLSFQEFTDLIEYLANLQQPESTLASAHGMPARIPEIARPIAARPVFSQPLKLPRSKVQTGLTAFHQVPGRSNDFLVLHQKGMIWRMTKNGEVEEKTTFADLTREVFSDRGPNGLLDVAFHPGFRKNRKYYLKYQV